MIRDWIQQPTMRVVATIGAWGLYVTVGSWIGIELLAVVHASNPRVWLLLSWIGRLGAVSFVASWAVIIVWAIVRWLLKR